MARNAVNVDQPYNPKARERHHFRANIAKHWQDEPEKAGQTEGGEHVIDAPADRLQLAIPPGMPAWSVADPRSGTRRTVVTLRGASDLTGTHPRTIYMWLARGLIEACYTPTGARRVFVDTLFRRQQPPLRSIDPVWGARTTGFRSPKLDLAARVYQKVQAHLEDRALDQTLHVQELLRERAGRAYERGQKHGRHVAWRELDRLSRFPTTPEDAAEGADR
jgi:hypothetical protein